MKKVFFLISLLIFTVVALFAQTPLFLPVYLYERISDNEFSTFMLLTPDESTLIKYTDEKIGDYTRVEINHSGISYNDYFIKSQNQSKVGSVEHLRDFLNKGKPDSELKNKIDTTHWLPIPDLMYSGGF